MNSKKKAIKDLYHAIDRNNRKIREKHRSLGEHLLSLKDQFKENSVLSDLFTRIVSLQKERQEKQDDIRNIIEAEDRIKELNGKISADRKKIEDKEKELGRFYLEIGNLSFEYYRQDRVKFQEFDSIFNDLVKLQEKTIELNRTEGELTKTRQEENVIGQIFNSLKKFYNNTRMDLIQHQFIKLLTAAGGALMDTEFVKQANERELNAITASLEVELKEIEKMKNRQVNREKEIEKVRDELNLAGFKGSLAQRVHELGNRVKRIEEDSADHFEKLGQEYIVHSMHKEITKPDIDTIYSDIMFIGKENEKNDKSIHDLERQIAVEELKEKKLRIEKQITSLANHVRMKEQEIEEKKKDISDIDGQINSLENMQVKTTGVKIKKKNDSKNSSGAKPD